MTSDGSAGSPRPGSPSPDSPSPDSPGPDSPAPGPDSDSPSAKALGRALRDCAAFATEQGWGAPPALFALVPTEVLRRQAPEVLADDDHSELSPVLQETEVADDDAALDELLASLSWPAQVAGAALIREIIVLPPGAEPADTREAAAARPESRQARLIAGVTRNGHRLALLSLRPVAGEPDDGGLLTQPGLAGDVLDALSLGF